MCVLLYKGDSYSYSYIRETVSHIEIAMFVSRHIEKTYACTHLHGSMVLMYGKNEVA